MKILSMTATFGKLSHETLTLKPGMNIIEAPNEWGKSTWCAFIAAMLYGIDTREKTTKTTLAEKERYAPWSGAPMEGRMDICWNGRNITIERRTKGRLIFGDFRAYETDSGLDVPELTASNCGVMLLGVERSVFARAGFLKMSDLPLTQDDALRRRLNALVTTGDESGAGDKLAQKLKELKNKCRFNRTGLIPQAEAERDQLEERLREVQDLTNQTQRIRERQQELERRVALLENHKQALLYAKAREESRHVDEALAARDAAKEKLDGLTAVCAELPSQEEASRISANLQKLNNESMSLQMEQQMLPAAPEAPPIPKRYDGLSGEEAVARAGADEEELSRLKSKQKKQRSLWICAWALIVIGLLAAASGIVLVLESFRTVCFIGTVGMELVGLALLLLAGSGKALAQKQQALMERYGSMDHKQWVKDAQDYAQLRQAYDRELAGYRQLCGELQQRRDGLNAQVHALTQGQPFGEVLAKWNAVEEKWQELADARRDYQRVENQIQALQAIARQVEPPKMPDELTCTLSETEAYLSSAVFEQKQNHLKLGNLQGQAESYGQEETLRSQLKAVKARIERLEETYQALELAQTALTKATGILQRRFAPRISKRAQELFEKMTGGRYQKVTLSEDLSLNVCSVEEDTLRPSQWRSDGTVDQLYLALRLAVAEELTPEAPLVLDDAMVRFDEGRLAVALNILRETAQYKQVILFTCQEREKKLYGEAE